MEESKTGSKRERKTLLLLPRVSAWAGLVSMPEIFLVLTILGFLSPGYSPISEYGSELGVGWYGAWGERVGVIIFGLLLITFAIGFHKSIANLISKRRRFTIGGLLVLSGAGAIISGIFTVSDPQLHGLGGFMVFGFPPVAQLIAGQKLRSFGGCRKYGLYTYVSGIATLLFDIFSTFYPIFKFVPALVPMVVALNTQLTGAVQRIQIVATWGWFTVSGARSLKISTTSEKLTIPNAPDA